MVGCNALIFDVRIMLNVMLMGKLGSPFESSCGLITLSQNFLAIAKDF